MMAHIHTIVMQFNDWRGGFDVLDCGHTVEREAWQRTKLGRVRACPTCRRDANIIVPDDDDNFVRFEDVA